MPSKAEQARKSARTGCGRSRRVEKPLAEQRMFREHVLAAEQRDTCDRRVARIIER